MDASIIELLTNIAIFTVVFFVAVFVFKVALFCLVAYIAYKKRQILIAVCIEIFKYFFGTPKKPSGDSQDISITKTTP